MAQPKINKNQHICIIACFFVALDWPFIIMVIHNIHLCNDANIGLQKCLLNAGFAPYDTYGLSFLDDPSMCPSNFVYACSSI